MSAYDTPAGKMATSKQVRDDQAGNIHHRTSSGPGSPMQNALGLTPRPPLPQKYNLIPNPGIIKQNGTSNYSVWSHLKNGFTNGETESKFTKLKPRHGSTPAAAEESSTKSLLIVALIFILAILALAAVYLNFPKLDEGEVEYIKVPRNIDDAKNLGRVLSRYSDKYYFQVLGGYFITYIFLQSFAIPGSIFLSILSGFLFPFPLALSLVCLCSAIGASFCYLLSYLVGRQLVKKYFPEKAAEWASHVQRHREHLLYYIVFLRITPFLPNWFINITSPVINVPIPPFFFGTFFGVAPPSFVAIQAGTTLHKLTSSGDALSWNSIGLLAVFALLSLLPVLFKKKLKNKFD